LALATEDCLEKFRQRLISSVVRRLAATQTGIAAQGEPATKPKEVFAGLELSLVEEETPPVAKLQPEPPPPAPEVIPQAAPEPDLDAFGGLGLALEEEGTPPPESPHAAQPEPDRFVGMDLALADEGARPEPPASGEPEPLGAPEFELEPASLPEAPPSPKLPPDTGARI
jgi:hypothetical protein